MHLHNQDNGLQPDKSSLFHRIRLDTHRQKTVIRPQGYPKSAPPIKAILKQYERKPSLLYRKNTARQYCHLN